MRVSSKGRYGLAAITLMACKGGEECITINSIAGELGISKIYLEQVFSLLKKAGLVNSIKGAQGGYVLADSPENITVYDILSAVELSIFEKTGKSLENAEELIEAVVQDLVYSQLDRVVEETLKNTSLQDLVTEIMKRKGSDAFMFYI